MNEYLIRVLLLQREERRSSRQMRLTTLAFDQNRRAAAATEKRENDGQAKNEALTLYVIHLISDRQPIRFLLKFAHCKFIRLIASLIVTNPHKEYMELFGELQTTEIRLSANRVCG